MSETLKFKKISAAEIKANGVQALASRPNNASQYGIGGLTPAQLKAWFDRLGTLLADALNTITETLGSTDAPKYIRIPLDESGIQNIDDILEAFKNGGMAKNVLKVNKSVTDKEKISLQEKLNEIDTDKGKLEESYENGTFVRDTLKMLYKNSPASMEGVINAIIDAVVTLEDDTAASIDLGYNPATGKLTVQLKNASDTAISEKEVTIQASGSSELDDGDVTTAKIADGAVTADKLAPALKSEIEKIADKVDKAAGKGLSSNDYTDAAKEKVDAIPANPKYTDTVYDDTDIKNRTAEIEGKIPTQASSGNQLADKDFVNSSISTQTAAYISNNGQPFTSVAALEAYTGTVTNLDYAYVTGKDGDGNIYYDRYKATVTGASVSWSKEFRLNNSSFTAAQWSAISSGITSELVLSYNRHMAAKDNPHGVTYEQLGGTKPTYTAAEVGALPANTPIVTVKKDTDGNVYRIDESDIVATYDENGERITDKYASTYYVDNAVASVSGGVPGYVKAEAEATIAKSFSHGNLGRTIRFIATSDSHNDANNMATANSNIAIGNEHCGQAIKYISDRIGLDFIAFLGDATWAGTADVASAYSQSMLIQDIEQFNGFISDGYKGIPNIRIVGNHDQLYTTKDTPGRLWNSGAYDLFGRYCNGIKEIPAGYGYLDLESSKVRVIYLNTSDIPSATTAGAYLGMTDEQVNWLAGTLLASGDKTGWKILILSHAPLDLINKSDVLMAYVNGTTYGSYNFANHNSAQLLANVHGHIHCYSYGYIGDKIRRFCIPNSNFQDNNHYKNNPSYAQWADTVTYPKTANSGKDTAFSLVTIDLDTNMCYVDNYGAGIDREFSCNYNTPPAPTALLNLDRTYVAGPTDESIGNHLDESKAYTNVSYGNFNFYSMACTQSDVSENSVTVKESGSGGICIGYPVHLPDLATHDYTLSFDYSGPGKQRAYYKLCTDAGAMGSLNSLIDDTAGASGTKSQTISAAGEAYTWLVVLFTSNTGNTKSYTNVKLEKAN